MKETDGWVKIKKYTDDGKPVYGKCILWPSFPALCKFMDLGAVDYGFPGPTCPIWHGESKSGWQPIETAPKDEEVFIGRFIEGNFKFGKSVCFYEKGNEFEGEYYQGWVWSIDDCDESVAECPTHWMPLPSPPQENNPCSD